MGYILTITNQKGGIGKTTTALALVSGMKKKGLKTLLIDMDPQGNSTFTAGIEPSEHTILEVLLRKKLIEDVVRNTSFGDVIPSSINLASADLVFNTVGKEYLLKETLEEVKDEYDLIVIDTPPHLGVVTVNALAAADGVLIPAKADIYSLQGFGQLADTLLTIKKYCNNNLEVLGIVLTMYNTRTNLSKEITDMISNTAAQLGTKVYNSKIRNCNAIMEAQASCVPLFEFISKSNAIDDYSNLLSEVIKDIKK